MVVVQGFRAIKRGDAEGVKEALYTKGPLAVSIDAAQPTFRFYSSGVYNDPSCKYKQVRPFSHPVSFQRGVLRVELD